MRFPHFNFVNKDDPSYKPKYGSTFTDRQRAIVEDKIPLAEVRVNEIKIIIRKSENIGDLETYELATNLYNQKTAPTDYFPSLSVEEAKKILQDLTPWVIDWGENQQN